MMKKNVKRSHSDFESDYDYYPNKKVVGPKNKSSKEETFHLWRIEDEDEYIMNYYCSAVQVKFKSLFATPSIVQYFHSGPTI